MEQRRSERKVVALDAVITCRRFGLLRGQMVDLGLGGGYVRAETSIVPLGTDVSVTFQPGEALCRGCITLEGRVVHQSLHGFGIEFDGLPPGCQALLERMLPAMPTVPARAAPVLRAI